eukprot:2217409-Pleurochrysis_carterae.AAC.1
MAASQTTAVSGPLLISWPACKGRNRPRMRYAPPPTIKRRLCRKKIRLRYSATATPPCRTARTPTTARSALSGGT